MWLKSVACFFIMACAGSMILNVQAKALEGRMWNGRTAKPGQFPYQALLYMTGEDGNHSFCGGSLAKTNYILTAAHCCVNVSSTTVYLGLVNVADTKADFVQKFDVPKSSFVIHEDYDPNTIANDICLLKLPSDAQLNANVSVVNLPTAMDTNPSQYNTKRTTASGFGQTNDLEGLHPTLQWANLTLSPHSTCALAYSFINPVSNSQLCSSKIRSLAGPCHGDSGGPLTIPDSTGKPVEIGLVSWGVGTCVGLLPVVFTYVPAYFDWLATNMV